MSESYERNLKQKAKLAVASPAFSIGEFGEWPRPAAQSEKDVSTWRLPNETQRSLCDAALRECTEEMASTQEQIYEFWERCLGFGVGD